jgi:uncharacterized surface protein with fasciclin (FAS1) repeats
MTDRVNLIDTIAKQDMFSTFARLLRSSKADEILNADGPFTVFAPTNDAFGKMPDPEMNGLTSEKDQVRLKALLSYHMIPAKFFAANLSGTAPTKSVSGQDVTFSDVGGLKINASGLQARNIEATNGIVHAIDTVLTPPAATQPAAAAAAATATPTTPAISATPAAETATTPAITPTPAAETATAPAIAPAPPVATTPAPKLV